MGQRDQFAESCASSVHKTVDLGSGSPPDLSMREPAGAQAQTRHAISPRVLANDLRASWTGDETGLPKAPARLTEPFFLGKASVQWPLTEKC